MLGAVTTLVFLATLWLVGAVAIRTLEESGAKIAAALAGRIPANQAAMVVQLRPIRTSKPVNSAPLLAAA